MRLFLLSPCAFLRHNGFMSKQQKLKSEILKIRAAITEIEETLDDNESWEMVEDFQMAANVLEENLLEIEEKFSIEE